MRGEDQNPNPSSPEPPWPSTPCAALGSNQRVLMVSPLLRSRVNSAKHLLLFFPKKADSSLSSLSPPLPSALLTLRLSVPEPRRREDSEQSRGVRDRDQSRMS